MSDMAIRCQFHAGIEIPACGCPPIDSEGALDYRALLATARAEIARLAAELAAKDRGYRELHATVPGPEDMPVAA